MNAPTPLRHRPEDDAQSEASNRRLRVLFVARAFPPTVGGMENLALHLLEHLRGYADVTAIINRRGKKALPAFLPYATVAAINTVRREGIDVVHLADALLAPLGAAVKLATGVKVTSSVCGLDVTYRNRLYQAVVPRALRRLDMTMPISGATMAAMRDRAGTSPPAQVIPLGVNPLPLPSASATEEFARLLGISPTRPVLLTVGRLVERKGVAWFVGAVLPLLPDGAIYAVVGEGPQRDAIAAAAAAGGVAHRVCMLGRVSDDLLGAAYARADIFVMPNIPVTGDMEGFGLVALEAAASGLPVVASDLEGITEALQNGRNGVLVPPGDGAAYARELTALLAMPSEERRVVGTSAAVCTQERYGWDRTARGYVRAMQLVVGAGRDNNVAGTPVES